MSGRPVVLLVDDEPNILSSLQRSLRKEGWTLRTAGGVDEALAELAREPADLVVSDHKMRGGKNGLDLLAAVGERYPRTRRVLLTGWPEQIPATGPDAVPVDAILTKPWEDAELKATLRNLLQL